MPVCFFPQITPTLNGPPRQARIFTTCTNSDHNCVSGIDRMRWAAAVQKVLILIRHFLCTLLQYISPGAVCVRLLPPTLGSSPTCLSTTRAAAVSHGDGIFVTHHVYSDSSSGHAAKPDRCVSTGRRGPLHTGSPDWPRSWAILSMVFRCGAQRQHRLFLARCIRHRGWIVSRSSHSLMPTFRLH
jgi:hypothetical protein